MWRFALLAALFFSSVSHAGLRCLELFPTERQKFSLPSDDETLLFSGATRDELLSSNSSFRVLVWNIYKAKKAGLWPDLREISDSADVLLLQETLLNENTCVDHKAFTSFSWKSALSFFTQAHTATGVSTVSRFLANQNLFLRSSRREPILNTPKMTLISQYPIENSEQQLVVANLHGLNFTPTGHLEDQLNELKDLISNHPGPLVVGGDFNTRNSNRIMAFHRFQKSLGLKNIRFKDDYREKRLDHLLVRGLRAKQARVLNAFKSSDHLPLWAELELE